MNITEIKQILNYLLDNNLKLQEDGLDKVAINLEGHAGIAKTSVVKQIAEERGAKYVRFNLAEVEEVGDILGVPIKEYLMYSPEQEEKWVTEKTVNQFINMGYQLCPNCEPRMNYAIPSWVPKDEDTEVILCLDDFLRGSMLFQQAIMSLIQFGEYISWKLPSKCHVILTSNPGDDSYTNLSELDDAQQSRMLTFNVEFDVHPWAAWAERQGLREEFINFALLNPEIFERGHIINARSYTLFANALKSISDLSTPTNLGLANSIAEGSFGADGEYIAGLFTQFINNKLDKLITPKSMIIRDWDIVEKDLESNVYTNGNYRADIASVLTTRLINYIENRFEKKCDQKESDQISKLLINLCTSKNKTLLTVDLLFKLIRELNTKYRAKCSKLMTNPEIAMKLLS